MASQVDPQMKHRAAKTALGARGRNTLAPCCTNTAGLQVATKAFLMSYDCCLVANDPNWNAAAKKTFDGSRIFLCLIRSVDSQETNDRANGYDIGKLKEKVRDFRVNCWAILT
jgi:hypothetical protein